MLPLEGITVVSLEQAIAAPFAARQLADLGARVIKIERPGAGDFARNYDKTVQGLSSHFVWTNRSKESLTLDLKDPEAKEILSKLLEKADVFIQNLAPGAVDRLGFSPQELREKYPRLIICGISGFGTTGPYQNKKAYDLIIQCEAGLVSISGTEDTPSKTGISVADIAAGMYAYSGILTALLAREKTGQGTFMDISMLEALGEWMGFPSYYAGYSGVEPKRTGSSHATIYPYGPFKAGDGKLVFLGIQNEREWVRFCEEVLGNVNLAQHPQFASNALRVENREELRTIIESAFADYAAEQILDRLEAVKIANARLNTMKEFIQHDQLRARNRWSEVESPAGPLRALIPPVQMQGLETIMKPIPAVGQHTASILQELGYDEESVKQLQEKGTI